MHIRSLTKVQPVAAYNLESILDIILQVIDVVERLEQFLGVDFLDKLQGGNNT